MEKLQENCKPMEKINMLGKINSYGRHFTSIRILIATDHFHRIEDETLLCLEDLGYRIIVKEIGPCTQVIQHKLNPNDTSKEASTRDFPGFEDIQDKMPSKNTMESNYCINVGVYS